MKYAGRLSERSWEHPAMPGAMVEVHDNLVNSPTVRRGVSVRLEDLPLERGPDGRLRATPAGLLIIAAVHGAASHGFEKVQHLCDIAQVVRGRAGPVDETVVAGMCGENRRRFVSGHRVGFDGALLERTGLRATAGAAGVALAAPDRPAAYDAGGGGAIAGRASPRRNMAAANVAPDVEEPPVSVEKR